MNLGVLCAVLALPSESENISIENNFFKDFRKDAEDSPFQETRLSMR